MNTEFSISIIKADQTCTLKQAAASEIHAVYQAEYQKGDIIRIDSSEKPVFAVVQLDFGLQPAFVCIKDTFEFPVPFDEKKFCYPPQSFSGNQHYIHIRRARPEEIAVRKNLAFNSTDGHFNKGFFPHASANIETRGESVFAARNAIDGIIANSSHGNWPFASWGINRDPQAQLKIDFGRNVKIDELVFYLRADFPHDAWWQSGTVHFSDGTDFTANFVKTGSAQSFKIPEKTIACPTLDTLIKADDPSPFPALTHLEVYGTEA